jgi:hypothetical protein
MSGKAHSKATKLAATFLARLSSADVAAAAFRVDVQTVRRWQAGGDAPPDDTWTAVRDVLLTRGAEMAARGDTRGLVQTLTAAGISDRNVRYGDLIRRREARREAEPGLAADSEPAWVTALDALGEPRGHLLGAEIRRELWERSERGDPGPPEVDEANVDLDAPSCCRTSSGWQR